MFFGDKKTLDSAEKRSDNTEDILTRIEYRKPGKQNIPYETSIGVVFRLKIAKCYSYPPDDYLTDLFIYLLFLVFAEVRSSPRDM